MEKRLTMILACLFLSLGVALAQTRVSGTVTSSEDGEPVVGASVKVVGSSTGTITDTNGFFQFTAPAGSRLEISYIGMITKVVKAGQNLRIQLDPQSTDIEEVVVVGYGSARKIGSITGQVATVNSDKLKNAPSSSALDALQGQVAGLTVLTSSGEAGDNATSLRIHGVGSLGAGSTPLYVVDGIPSSSRSVMAMNPNDIKSVTVLKDASSTSIYGSRASNGVVYITTKNGGYNTRSTITYRTQFGWSTLADKDTYEQMMSGDELYNFWLDAGIFTADQLKSTYDDNGYRYNTKWYEVYQQFNNPQTQNDIQFEGGSDKISYLISASQFHQRGTAIGNYYNRYTVRSNIDAKPKDWLRVGLNMNFSYDKRQRNANWGNSGNISNYLSGGLSYLLNPLYPATDADGNSDCQRYAGSNMVNPEYYMKNHPSVNSRYGLVGSTYVEISPLRGLKITSRIGADMYFLNYKGTTYPSYLSRNNGSRGRSNSFEYSYTMTNTIEYSFDVAEDHHFTLLAGHEGVKNSYDYFYAGSSGLTDDRLLNLQNGTQSTYDVSESYSASRFLSFFGRVNYNLMDRYFLDLSIRNDGCTRFGTNKKHATFWSVGGMWKIKSEEFMQDVTWLNSLDFRISYGTQGNASIGDYPSLGLISAATNYNESATRYYSQPANPDLTWEKQKLFTVGIKARLFDRLDIDASYYLRNTSDMLMDVPYPYTSGFTSLTENVGTLRNQGIDLTIGVDILKAKDYYLRFNTNFNYNAQKVTELFQGRQRWEIANTMVAYVVGNPVMFYLPLYAGVNEETGAPQWYVPGDDVDVNTTDEVTSDYDETALTQNSGKKRYAPVNGGFGIQAGWKGLSLAVDFSYELGKYLVNNDRFFYDNPTVFPGYNTRKDAADFWTTENTDAKYPDWSQGYSMQFDSHLLENASFLRLKNLQIGYDLPKSLLAFQNVVHGLKFTFTGRNLLTVTGYTGMDPEVDSNLTYGVIGNSKQYLFGVEVTF